MRISEEVMPSSNAISAEEIRALLQTYVKAKDENRPYCMSDAFDRDAVVEMSVYTGAISFPARMDGIVSITDALVRKFGQTYENVHTFYLDTRPCTAVNAWGCDWLVAMSDKATGEVRVGCGDYDWHFIRRERWLVDRLHITIAAMAVLPSEALDSVMAWGSSLPYPWCGNEQVLAQMPRIFGLEPVRDYLGRVRQKDKVMTASSS